MLPLTQATWPLLQADCSLRVAKRALKDLALARFLAATSGEMVAVAAGSEVSMVGTPTLGEPVTLRVADDGGMVWSGVVDEAGVSWDVGAGVDEASAFAVVLSTREVDDATVWTVVVVVSPGTGNAKDKDDCIPLGGPREAPSSPATVVGGPVGVSVRLLAGRMADPFRRPVVGYGGRAIELNMGGRVATVVMEAPPDVVDGTDIVLRGGGRKTAVLDDCTAVVEGPRVAADVLFVSSMVLKTGLGVDPSSSSFAVTAAAEVERCLRSCE